MNIDESYLDYYKGPVSDHFDGERFYNPWNRRPKKSFWDIMKWRIQSKRQSWPEHVENPSRLPVPVMSDRLRATYIGHATFLIQANGFNLLTDPFFSDRASPFASFGQKRVRPPLMPLEKLPKIDAVFVSHNHYDHMDLPSLSWLASHYNPLFITPLGNPRLMKGCMDKSCHIQPIDWHEKVKLGDSLELTLTPAQHWSRRGLDDTNRDLWGGIYLKTSGSSLYFSADTGYDAGLFQDIRTRHGSPDLALLPIGAYEPRWFMKYSHMSPEEAIETHKILGPRQSMGFHHETLQLSDEPFTAARELIRQGLKKRSMREDSFIVPYPGVYIEI